MREGLVMYAGRCVGAARERIMKTATWDRGLALNDVEGVLSM
jgi:hypothetical protein